MGKLSDNRVSSLHFSQGDKSGLEQSRNTDSGNIKEKVNMSSDILNIVHHGINAAKSLINAAESLTPEPATPFADTGEISSTSEGDMMVDISPEYKDLINKQIEVQTQLQEVSFISNIERTNHESKMAPVRNIRLA